MAVTYTKGTDVALLDPAELAERLAAVLRGAMPWLVTLSEDEATAQAEAGKWSAKQVIGHLTDSAVNNLGRIVRMQLAPGESLPGYAQDGWVRVQHYAERGWPEVLALWFALNEHVEWTIAHVERKSLANGGTVAGQGLTLGFLIEDYVAHMEHHLRALRADLARAGCRFDATGV
ncbi:DinB family protein [Edaphobacter sp.]|uniref:DinB family protein n=1 Tax=Edaphobacter sp. TaxID=1934404 RepID=UPI002DBC8C3B|nr:DinB family protein [Edaphobacter sp.]HEU5342176.1 DinB family protein [Edaphobacter sp.]